MPVIARDVWRTLRSAFFLPAAVFLVGVAAFGLSFWFHGRVRASFLPGNFPVNAGAGDARDIRANNSPTLVRNPVRQANLAISNRVDTPRFSCSLHFSTDGGATWRETGIPLPPTEEPKCYSPEAAFGQEGTLYLTFITLKGPANTPNAAWITRSQDGGQSFSAPTQILGPLAFQLRLLADPRRDGPLYLSWLQASGLENDFGFARGPQQILMARSEDGGATWQGPVKVTPDSLARPLAPAMATGPRGEIFVSYLNLRGDRLDYIGGHKGRGGRPYNGAWSLMVGKSLDRGATWANSSVSDLIPTERLVPFIPPTPSLAVDQRTGRTYAAFHDGRLGDSDVWLWRSADASRWEGGRRVNDTARNDRTRQYLPALGVAPSGRLDILYYDRRSDQANRRNEVSLQYSLDEGQSFSESLTLSDKPFDSRIGYGSERGMPDLGSRLALLSTDRLAVGVWADTRAGTESSGKQDLTRAFISFSRLSRTERALHYLLRYGGATVAALALAILFYIKRMGASKQTPSAPQ